MVEQSNLAQAREVDDLIVKLRDYREEENKQESIVKATNEKLKKEKATLEGIILKKNRLIDELSGKRTYPLFDELRNMDAEQDKLETHTEAAQETATTEPPQQITLERVGETNNIVKLILGEQSAEISLETMEKRLTGEDPDEYPTYDAICDAGWAGMQELSQEELLALFNEFSPKPEPTEEPTEASDNTSNIANFLKPEGEETLIDAEKEEKSGKPKLEVYQDNDGRICISSDNRECKSAFNSAAKILDRFGVNSVEHLTQKHLAELWKENPSDWSYKNEENNVEEWPESIHALPKPDGSLILKCGTRTRKVNAVDVPTNLDTTSQDQLNALWVYDKAYEYNPEHDKIDIPSLSGKKPRGKKKLTEAIV